MAGQTNVSFMFAPEAPLDLARLRAALPARPWELHLVTETGSTNADVRAAAASGTAGPGYLLLAEHQRAGRGRHGRTWVAPPGSGLTFSLLVHPEGVPAERWGWIPLLTGVALLDALNTGGTHLALKWPNDALNRAGRKVAGVLVERVQTPAGPMAVIGIGINTHGPDADFAVDGASSLQFSGLSGLDRTEVLGAVLAALANRFDAWCAQGGDPVRSGLAGAYRACCATLGAQVRIERPGGLMLTGVAADIAVDGALVVAGPTGPVTVAAGDVTHLRSVR
ncbi:MAG: biotin--[acetyl-CoA-carboxylase] ligase [Sporichthyaceae bacterium]